MVFGASGVSARSSTASPHTPCRRGSRLPRNCDERRAPSVTSVISHYLRLGSSSGLQQPFLPLNHGKASGHAREGDSAKITDITDVTDGPFPSERPPERVLLRRLAVFAGAFSLRAANKVAGSPEIAPSQAADALSSLTRATNVTMPPAPPPAMVNSQSDAAPLRTPLQPLRTTSHARQGRGERRRK
jgi:hypothetical protein